MHTHANEKHEGCYDNTSYDGKAPMRMNEVLKEQTNSHADDV